MVGMTVQNYYTTILLTYYTTPHPMQKLKNLTAAFFPPVAWAGFIFILSSNSALAGFDISVLDFVFKKLSHMFVYAVLYVLLHRGIIMTFDKKYEKKYWLFAFLFVLIYAVSDEYHQSLVPGRYPTLRDVGYDMLGASLAFLRLYKYI